MNENQNNQNKEQELSDILAVRRQKLADLQAAGKDPFTITKYSVTHHSTDITGDCDPETHVFRHALFHPHLEAAFP